MISPSQRRSTGATDVVAVADEHEARGVHHHSLTVSVVTHPDPAGNEHLSLVQLVLFRKTDRNTHRIGPSGKRKEKNT